jgi:hypothetical protein
MPTWIKKRLTEYRGEVREERRGGEGRGGEGRGYDNTKLKVTRRKKPN